MGKKIYRGPKSQRSQNPENSPESPQHPERPPEVPSIDLEMSRQNDANSFEETLKMTGNGTAPTCTERYEGPKVWRSFVKNWGVISQLLALLAVFFLVWAIGFSMLRNFLQPDSTIMRIAFLFLGAYIFGILVTFLWLPDMLGMLFWGVFYTNVGFADFSEYARLEAFLREMALVNIMLLAGLGLDWKAFKKLFGMVMRLTLIPTVAEVVIIAVLAYFLLQMPWLWGFLLGLVITAVSPNVVVTVMLKLKEERIGLNNGIHTLIYAMTTCNDVVSIFLFGVVLGIIFSEGNMSQQLLQGPVGIAIGIVFGFVFGLLILYLPSKKSKYVNELRFVLMLLGGTISIVGSKTIDYPSAGALGCVMIAFVAGIGWRRQSKEENIPVCQTLDLLWKFLKPVSFSLIGKEVNFSVLDPKVVGYGVIIILVGCAFRLSASYLSTYGGELTWKERAYVTISGFPKATVQAALGPIALDSVRSSNSANTAENLGLANIVLVISVLAIIFTAPLGAVLMIRLAPVWLKRSPPQTDLMTTTTVTDLGMTVVPPPASTSPSTARRRRRRTSSTSGKGPEPITTTTSIPVPPAIAIPANTFAVSPTPAVVVSTTPSIRVHEAESSPPSSL